MATAAPRADSWACSIGTSLGTLPNGPIGVPSVASAPWPDKNARLPESRTQEKENLNPGGGSGRGGSWSPSVRGAAQSHP